MGGMYDTTSLNPEPILLIHSCHYRLTPETFDSALRAPHS